MQFVLYCTLVLTLLVLLFSPKMSLFLLHMVTISNKCPISLVCMTRI